MERKERMEAVNIKVVWVLAVIVIMLTAGIGLSGKMASAASQDDCIVLEKYSSETAGKKYNIDNYEILVQDEAICIYKKGNLLKKIQDSSWDTAWIVDNTLYFSEETGIYYYDFSKESIKELMTIKAVGSSDYQEREPEIIKVFVYEQSYLYVEVENGSLYDYSVIRINLKSKTQQTLIEQTSSILELLGSYNNYMYFAYPTMDGGWYHGFARVSLGENPREEVIEDSTSEVFMYGDKIYYLEKQGSFSEVDSNLKSYDLASGTKSTLENWKNHDMGIKKIENGIIYLYGLQTKQEFQYNISTGGLTNTNYVEPLRDIKVSHQLIYKDKKTDIKDVCKITWDKSFEGNIEIAYSTYSYSSDWKKQIKATKGNNYCLLNLTGGKTYYIKVRTYKGTGENKVCSSESQFKFFSRKITSSNQSKQPGSNYIKMGKNLYYSYKENGKKFLCKRNIKTGKQKIITKIKNEICFMNATNRYFYYMNSLFHRDLYAYDVKKGTNKKMNTNRMYICKVIVGNGKVICEGEDGEFTNPDLYCFNLNGSKKRKIGKGYASFIYKKRIYWEQIKGNPDTEIYYRFCSCDMYGKNERAETKWIPEKAYYKIARKVDYSAEKTFYKIKKNRKWLN